MANAYDDFEILAQNAEALQAEAEAEAERQAFLKEAAYETAFQKAAWDNRPKGNGQPSDIKFCTTRQEWIARGEGY